MKLTLLLTVIAVINLSAATYSQEKKLNLNLSSATIGKVFKAIEDQSDYNIFYKDNQININKEVNLSMKDATINEILDKAFKNTHLSYTVLDKIIVVTDKGMLQFQVTGIVYSASDHITIVGATVLEKGTQNAAITDMNGKFKLDVKSANSILVVSFMGFESVEVPVNGASNLEISLKGKANLLNEIVVVGYGTVRKANVVGSIAKINAESIQDRPVTRVEQALQGQMAGVSVRSTSGAPGSDITINVRGTASINGVSTPLYVVDGVPIDNISGINPGDIQSIDVLKDAASAAIYGSRGSNGVVLVTTKKGKIGKPVITLDAYQAFSTIERKVDVLTSDEWITFNKKWYDRQWIMTTGQSANVSQADRIAFAQTATNKVYDTRTLLGTIRNTYGIYDPWWGTSQLEAIDWQNELFRTGLTSNIQLNASGASENINYSISGGIYKQQGIVYGSSYDRYNFRANVEAKITNRIKVGLNIAPSYGLLQGTNVDGKDNAVARSLSFSGWVIPGSGRNAGADPYKFYDTWGAGPNNVSPYIQATVPTRKTPDIRVNTSINTTINLMEGLNLTGLTAWNTRTNSVQSYTPTWMSGTWDVAKHPGEYSTSSYSTLVSNNLLIQGLLTYNKVFGIHSIDAMVGASQESYSENTSLQSEANFPNDKTWVFNKVTGSTLNNNEIYYNKNALVSYFGRLQYALLDRYLMTFSLRRDGSSKFGSKNRWGYFPSVSGAWKINEESFLKDVSWLGTAKLRLSWGKAGNDRIGSAQFLSNMSALNYPTGTTQVLTNGYVVGNIANPLLGWETTTSYNLGFDFGVLKDRIYLSVDYYKKSTKDLLLQAPVSLITGYTNMMDNVGNVDNQGFEFEINSTNITIKDFSWNSSFNLSLNRNKITSLGSDNSDIRSGQGSTIIQRVGSPINSYFLLGVERTLRTSDFESDGKTPKTGIAIYSGQKAGDTKWVDVNKDGVITSADYAVAGNYQPKFEWGFTNTFKYKDFDASILTQGRAGGKLLSIGSRGWNRATNGPTWNYMSRWLYDAYWSETEPGDGKTPGFFSTVTGNQYDTNWLYDASYVRIKNITLGYTLPFKANKIITKARIYASCDNVYIWDHYDPGFSPEAATQDNASSDWGAYPQARTFSFGINVTF